jgi:7-keto-8-aminopelargonate synthetase-like enzyme
LKRVGFEIRNPVSQIIPLIVGKETKAVEFSNYLLNEGVFVQAIRYPTVRKGRARLRITLTAIHQQEHLDYAADMFERVGKKTGFL